MKEKEWKKWVFWFSLVVACIVVYKTIDSVLEVVTWLQGFVSLLMPFILAVIVAYILYKPSKTIELKLSKIKYINKIARTLSIVIVYVILALILVLVFKFVIPNITTSIVELGKNLPGYYTSAIDYINNIPEDSIWSNFNLTGIVKSIENIDITKFVLDIINLENVSNIIKGISGAATLVFNIFVTVVVSVYLLQERNDIKSFIKHVGRACLKDETYEKYKGYFNKTNGIFYNFLSSQILDACIMGVVCFISLSILNVKYAPLLATMIGLFNVIPYFGAIVACSVSVIITIFTGGIGQAIWMLIVLLVVQQIDSNIINPRILGTSLNISPILVIFSVTAGGAYFGVLGMFLAVPTVAFIKIIIEDKLNEKIAIKEAQKNKVAHESK